MHKRITKKYFVQYLEKVGMVPAVCSFFLFFLFFVSFILFF